MNEQIAANKRKAALVFAAYGILVFLLFSALGLISIVGFALALVIAVAATILAYRHGERIALRVAHAVPADPSQYARLDNLIEGLCIASGLPRPALYVVDDPAPNAFSVGRNPKYVSLVVTTGLLEKLTRIELEGVLAHELSHIRNSDVAVATAAIGTIGAFGVAIPKFAATRDREYVADASGVQLTRYPPGLISALKKLEADPAMLKHAPKAIAHLWIEPSVAAAPPLDERIAALEQL